MMSSFDWFWRPVLRMFNKHEWDNDLARSTAYMDLACLAAEYAKGAAKGGYLADSLVLQQTSRGFITLSKKSEDQKAEAA